MNDLAARALSLFDDYVELPASERERKLLELAAHEPALHDALRALLGADAQGDDHLLDRSPADILADKHRSTEHSAAEQDERAGVRIGIRLGPWRIDRVIGHGGMGTVYEVHRNDGEYQQRVARKCIRTELATPQLQAAFRDERHLLARLDHAGIAARACANASAFSNTAKARSGRYRDGARRSSLIDASIPDSFVDPSSIAATNRRARSCAASPG